MIHIIYVFVIAAYCFFCLSSCICLMCRAKEILKNSHQTSYPKARARRNRKFSPTNFSVAGQGQTILNTSKPCASHGRAWPLYLRSSALRKEKMMFSGVSSPQRPFGSCHIRAAFESSNGSSTWHRLLPPPSLQQQWPKATRTHGF